MSGVDINPYPVKEGQIY